MERDNDTYAVSSESGDKMDMDSLSDDRQSKARGEMRIGAPSTPSRYEEHR